MVTAGSGDDRSGVNGEVHVALVYVPYRLEPSGTTITVGRTWAPEALKVVRDVLLAEGELEVARWGNADRVLGELKRGDVARMRRLLDLILPEEEEPGTLHVWPQRDRAGQADGGPA